MLTLSIILVVVIITFLFIIRNLMKKTEKEFAHFQFKIPATLWSKFKIKTIEENSPTYKDKIIELIERYVRT